MQLDLFDTMPAPKPAAAPYKQPKAFSFPCAEWERLGNAGYFVSVCLRHGTWHNGVFWPTPRRIMSRVAHIAVRRAYGALVS